MRKEVAVICKKCGKRARLFEGQVMWHVSCPDRGLRGLPPPYVPIKSVH